MGLSLQGRSSFHIGKAVDVVACDDLDITIIHGTLNMYTQWLIMQFDALTQKWCGKEH